MNKNKKNKNPFEQQNKAFEDVHEKASIFKNVTTLHGTSHYSRLKGKQLFLWSFLIVCNLITTIVFLTVIRERYNDDSIVTKIYSDCTVDMVPFPAVSICNFNHVSKLRSYNVERILKSQNISQSEIGSFFHNLPHLRVGLMFPEMDNYTNIMKIIKNHYFNIRTLMKELHQRCEDLLIYCEFNNKAKNCDTIFQLQPTYEGFCCVFNYVGVDENVVENINQDEDFEYYYDETEGNYKKTNIIATSQSGRFSGLRVVINIDPQDQADWSSAFAFGAKILISDPNDYPETSACYKLLELGESLDLKVMPKVYLSDPDLRSVALEKRSCYFHDEVDLDHTDRYSFETCTTECKMNTFLQVCGCVPYKYPAAGKTARVCEFRDMPCLRDIKANWDLRKKECKPRCFQECNDKGYSLTRDVVPFFTHTYPEDVIRYWNVSELSGLRVYFDKPTCNCYRMSLLMDTSYFIATYGGVFSLSFGASIITLVEVLYLLTSWITKLAYRYVCDRFLTTQFVH